MKTYSIDIFNSKYTNECKIASSNSGSSDILIPLKLSYHETNNFLTAYILAAGDTGPSLYSAAYFVRISGL